MRRLLLALAGPAEAAAFRLHWSRWRRRRQAEARRSHYRRRGRHPPDEVPL